MKKEHVRDLIILHLLPVLQHGVVGGEADDVDHDQEHLHWQPTNISLLISLDKFIWDFDKWSHVPNLLEQQIQYMCLDTTHTCGEGAGSFSFRSDYEHF